VIMRLLSPCFSAIHEGHFRKPANPQKSAAKEHPLKA